MGRGWVVKRVGGGEEDRKGGWWVKEGLGREVGRGESEG